MTNMLIPAAGSSHLEKTMFLSEASVFFSLNVLLTSFISNTTIQVLRGHDDDDDDDDDALWLQKLVLHM